METPSRIVLEDVRAAHRFARDERVKVSEGATFYDSLLVPVPQKPLFDYFFQVQGEIEKKGSMNYNDYAVSLWNNFYGDVSPVDSDSDRFNGFRSNMIANLHSIDMEPLVYPHVKDNMAMLLRARGHQVKGVSLWSTGDVAATGYQVGKIESSGVIRDFFNAVKNEIPKEERAGVLEKTSYMVDDDKFERIADYAEELINSGQDHIKIVVIEDNSGNFGKVREELDSRLGKNNNIEVFPIWATYSREGQTEEKKAVDSHDFGTYVNKRNRLNAIDSFAELLDHKFDEIFQDAHVFVDFDGVIGDNVRMRQEQAKAIYHSLLVAGLSLGLSDEEISERLTIQEAA